MARDCLLVVDQGTTSTRAVVYNSDLQPVGQGQAEIHPVFPHSGWVEQDAAAIIRSVGPQVTQALLSSGVKAEQIAAIGLTNQRETTVVWDRTTGRPLAPAIVWQDRRTADRCARLRDQAAWISPRTGLVIDPYFSATKIAWILENVPEAAKWAESGDLAAGTVDSYMIHHLTGGRQHVTDVTNASRTLLMDLQTGSFDEELCNVFGVPIGILPEIRPSAGDFGKTQGLDYLPDGIPITGVAGDQQASLIGQGCLKPGQAKCTFGTGAFLLAHLGGRLSLSTNGLITTRAATLPGDPPQYALEGSVFIAGAAVQWFRDGLRAIGAAPQIDQLASQAAPESEVTFVPSLTGLGAPYWNPEARGTIFGLDRATTLADVARAALEGVGFQIADLLEAIQANLDFPAAELQADGGMARSDPFLQFLADILNLPVRRAPFLESTAIGAALLAGLGVGLWPGRDEAVSLLRAGSRAFSPAKDAPWRARSLERWRRAVESVQRHYHKESSLTEDRF